MYEAGLLRHASTINEHKNIASACIAQLYDLQELTMEVFKRSKATVLDPNVDLYNDALKLTESLLTTLVGSGEDSEPLEWTRVGFDHGVDPLSQFNQSLRWAGLQDFNEFLSQDDMVFKKMFVEHMAFSKPQNVFPLASASLAVSQILFDVFNIDQHILAEEYETGFPDTIVPVIESSEIVESSGSTVESELAKMGKLGNLRPLFFDWNTLHSSGISNFLRLWQTSHASRSDFQNIREVVRILFEQAIPKSSPGNLGIDSVLSKLDTISYEDIREIQLRAIENDLNQTWGPEITLLHQQYLQEAYEFVKEQRIRLLLRGDWFFVDDPTMSKNVPGNRPSTGRRYFMALSPSRKILQYSEYGSKLETNPAVEALSRSVDLTSVTKVVITPLASPSVAKGPRRVSIATRTKFTKISLIVSGARDNHAAVSFYADTLEKAAAWGDGLLILRNRPYQSAETKKYIEMFAQTKLRIQMLQITPDDVSYAKAHSQDTKFFEPPLIVSDDFYYQ